MSESAEHNPTMARLQALAAETRRRLPAEWLAKARHVRRLRPGERWPAWSTGELLAVALIVGDDEQLAAMDYTQTEALDRLRYEIGEPSVEAAAAVFADLRAQL